MKFVLVLLRDLTFYRHSNGLNNWCTWPLISRQIFAIVMCDCPPVLPQCQTPVYSLNVELHHLSWMLLRMSILNKNKCFQSHLSWFLDPLRLHMLAISDISQRPNSFCLHSLWTPTVDCNVFTWCSPEQVFHIIFVLRKLVFHVMSDWTSLLRTFN